MSSGLSAARSQALFGWTDTTEERLLPLGGKQRTGSEPLQARAYLDSGAVVELEEPGRVVIDINHLDGDVCVLMQRGLPAVCGSEPQGVARGLSEMPSGELAMSPLISAP